METQINEDQIREVFPGIDSPVLLFMMLSMLPIGDKYVTKYGTVHRVSTKSFEITVNDQILNEVRQEKEQEKHKKDFINELFNA